MVYRDIENMPLTLTVRDIADTLAIGRNRAYKLVKDGQLRSIKIGNQIRVTRESFVQFLRGECQSA